MDDLSRIGSNPFSFGGNPRDEAAPAGPVLTPDLPISTRPGLNILVVEDDPLTSRSLTRLLGKLGHRVVAAGDGAEAWSLLQRRRYQVVLSDWMMPGMDGLELCRRVRHRAGIPYTYVILATARGGCDDRIEGLSAGADDFLAKPIDVRELAARLAIAGRILALQEELERKNAELEALATTDPLTGLSNRRRFDESLRAHAALSARRDLPLSLVLLDVDRFKAYNDAFGHPSGDEALRRIGGILRKSARSQDVVARYGGEEFAVVLPATDAREAGAFAERLRAAIAGAGWPLVPVTASLGVATFDSATMEGADLVERADRALYRSKRDGRDRITVSAGLELACVV